jgi:UDP-N-acetylmuramoyl-tripeptide--D-alanyl-D-alanine ligase
LDAVAAAQAVARTFGMDDDEIAAAAKEIRPQPGRMQPLEGLRDSKLIDDTYNASPEAVKAALEYLFSQHAPQKIALLGQMNELGNINESAHREIGKMCSPKNLDLVVTLGPEANRYLAEEAEAAGCQVIRTNSPIEAGQKIKAELKEGALVLLKGSQNGVFAEEAVRVLLAKPTDKRLLVRQTPQWLKKKRAQFKDF